MRWQGLDWRACVPPLGVRVPCALLTVGGAAGGTWVSSLSTTVAIRAGNSGRDRATILLVSTRRTIIFPQPGPRTFDGCDCCLLGTTPDLSVRASHVLGKSDYLGEGPWELHEAPYGKLALTRQSTEHVTQHFFPPTCHNLPSRIPT